MRNAVFHATFFFSKLSQCNAQIIEDNAKEDEIGLNKTVEVEFVEDGTIETYRLVTTVRNNPFSH